MEKSRADLRWPGAALNVAEEGDPLGKYIPVSTLWETYLEVLLGIVAGEMLHTKGGCWFPTKSSKMLTSVFKLPRSPAVETHV